MKNENLIIDKLEGFSGIRLKGENPLTFKPGINLLIGRNGCGKTNLMRLVQLIATNRVDLTRNIESTYFVKLGKASLKKQGASIAKRFGEVTLVKHSIKGVKGHVKMSLKNVNEEFVLRNIINDPSGFHSHININCKTQPVVHRLIHGNINPPKFEMSGYLNNSNVFSGEHNNAVHSSMQGPIQSVSEFIRSRLKEFYEGEDFLSRIRNFENSVNEKFRRFLGTTNKRLRINSNDIASSGRISLSLMDNENYIDSANISTGESMLFNLIFSLASAKEENSDILSLDEPDVHMHDDMIRVLVNELSELSQALPHCIIIVASHSTALIEQLAALGKSQVHIITFDNERNVRNSENDIELINALQQNGVHFSPLMLSKRRNIFIENQFEKGKGHKNFFLKFFPFTDLPNIVPIGNSGNVQDSKSFASIFEDILKVTNLNFVGIQDGDIWLKPRLVQYLKGDLKLQQLITILKNQGGIYIPQAEFTMNSYFFNCWEIENLYLMDEMLPCWKLNNRTRLTKAKYMDLLQKNRSIISDAYFDTFFKSISRIKVDKKYSIQKMHAFLHDRFELIDKSIGNPPVLEERMSLLVNSILDTDLVNWLPGKELKNFIQSRGYTFDESNFNFEGSRLALEVRQILTDK